VHDLVPTAAKEETIEFGGTIGIFDPDPIFTVNVYAPDGISFPNLRAITMVL